MAYKNTDSFKFYPFLIITFGCKGFVILIFRDNPTRIPVGPVFFIFTPPSPDPGLNLDSPGLIVLLGTVLPEK